MTVQKTPWDLIQFRHDLLNLIKMMTKDWPFPNPNACGYCGYHNLCTNRGLFYASQRLATVKATMNQWEGFQVAPTKGVEV